MPTSPHDTAQILQTDLIRYITAVGWGAKVALFLRMLDNEQAQLLLDELPSLVAEELDHVERFSRHVKELCERFANGTESGS